MADFDPKKLSKKELQDLFKELEKIGALTSNVVDDERSIRDTILDQTKQLKFQQTLKRDILRATNKLYDIQYDLRNEYDRELGTRQASLAIDKQITQIEKSNRSLAQDIVDLRKQDTEFSHELANSLKAQVEQGLQYKEILKDQQDTSEQIRKNIGVQGFQGLSELFQKMGGKASQLAGPFEDAAEAAREIAQENVEGNKKIEERKQILEKIKSGELTATKKNLEGIEVTNKKGQKLYGEAAKNALKSGKAVTNVGKAMSKGQMAMKSFGAGIKAFGPILKKAVGPIAIVLSIVKAIKFFVGAMFQASKEAAELGRSLGISSESGEKIRKQAQETAASFAEQNIQNRGINILQKEILAAQKEINSALGTAINFQEEFGELGRSATANFSVMVDKMGLSKEAAMLITKESLRTGQASEEITKEVLGTVRAQNLLNKTSIDVHGVLEDIAKLSYEIKGAFGLSTVELAQAVYEAKRLGFEMTDLNSVAGGLLDFESSISKELEAELILGRDINLEKARTAALNNDLVGVGRELRAQNIDIVELQKENRIAAESAAAAMGMTVEQAIKAQEEFELRNKQEEALNKSIGKGLKLVINGKEELISLDKLRSMNLGDLKGRLEGVADVEGELKNILGEQMYQLKIQEDAQTKFNRALDKARESFANLVDSGVLDQLVDALTGFLNSSLVAGFAERGEKRRRAEEARNLGDNISAQQLEALEGAEFEHTTAGALTAIGGTAATGALIGSVVPGVGTAIGALVGAGVGAIGSIIASGVENSRENEANAVARELGLQQVGAGDTTLPVNDFTIRTHPQDTLVMAGGTKLNEDSKETNQLLRTLITAVENGGNVYLNNQLVGEISSQQQLNSFRAGS